MPDLFQHLIAYWHLWTVATVLGLIALQYTLRFALPALQLKGQLGHVNAQLAVLAQQPPSQPIDLSPLKTEVMTSPTLQHAWEQYAMTLQPKWSSADVGPLGVARQRASQLSQAFFAHLDLSSRGGRLDLSRIENMSRNDPHMAQLWREYIQVVETVQRLENSAQNTVGQWQASHGAELYFTEHALVDSPLQSNFYKHVPGILTGVGIIGTFTGLIAGLIGFDVSRPEQVQAELSQLVQTVGHAFLVSALAIALAMVFTWVEKSVLTSRYRQVEEMQQWLDTLFSSRGDAPFMERLTLASEMQTALSFQILNHLREASTHAQRR
jgi:hypothetical protein